MGIPHDTQFLYRFQSTADKIYGPRPLDFLAAYYAECDDCSCARADGDQAAGPWRPVREVVAEMLPIPLEPATERQRKRLANLKIAPPAGITADEARALIREAEAKLPPTPTQLRKASEAKLTVPSGATRGDVDDLLDDHERRKAIRALRRKQVSIADDADWEEIERAEDAAAEAADVRTQLRPLRAKGVAVPDGLSPEDADEWCSAWDELKRISAEVKRELGLAVPIPAGVTLEGVRELERALYATLEAASQWETMLDWLAELSHVIPRVPRKDEQRAVMLDLFERVRAKTWRGDDADDLWLARRALGISASAESQSERGDSSKSLASECPASTTQPDASPNLSPRAPSHAPAPLPPSEDRAPQTPDPTRSARPPAARDALKPSWWRKLLGG